MSERVNSNNRDFSDYKNITFTIREFEQYPEY